MMTHLDNDTLTGLVLGMLTPDAHREADAHVADCTSCSLELDDIMGLSSVLSSGRERLLDAARAMNRFDDWIEEVAELFDLTTSAADALLRSIDDPHAWGPGPGRGVKMMLVPSGPQFARAHAGLVRVRPGDRFPNHRHGGEEHALILQGSCTDTTTVDAVVSDDEQCYRRGARPRRSEGSSHVIQALMGPDLVVAVRVDGSVDLLM